ncbi:MAG: hypothetical protein WC717_03330 [Candidatus Micrarchaeia archaeon]|jgi:hypothetical protein
MVTGQQAIPASKLTMEQKCMRLGNLANSHEQLIRTYERDYWSGKLVAPDNLHERAESIFKSPHGDKIKPSRSGGSATEGQARGSNRTLMRLLGEATSRAMLLKDDLEFAANEANLQILQSKAILEMPGFEPAKEFSSKPIWNLDKLPQVRKVFASLKRAKIIEATGNPALHAGTLELLTNTISTLDRCLEALGKYNSSKEEADRLASELEQKKGERQQRLAMPEAPAYSESENYETCLGNARESGRNIHRLRRMFPEKP